jgi:hypothetical protein
LQLNVCSIADWAGMCPGTCPHEVVLGGVNMVQSGERYAYAHYLLLRLLDLGVPINMVNYDVGCMWSPWALKMDGR